jgi:hypothetical protein
MTLGLAEFDTQYLNNSAMFKKGYDGAPPDVRAAIGTRDSFDKLVHRYVVSDKLTGYEPVDRVVKSMGDFYSSRVSKIFDKDYLDALVKTGKATLEDVTKLRQSGPNYAARYMSRMYDEAAIRARPQEFKDLVRANIAPEKWAEDADFYDDLDSSVVDRVLNAQGARARSEDTFLPRGLNPRKLSIQDEDLINSGFIASDIRRAYANTVHRYLPDILLLRTFGDVKPKSIFGVAGQVEQVGDELARRRGLIADEYADLMRSNPGKQKEIQAEMERVRDSMDFLFDEFRYRTGLFADASESPYNLVRDIDVASRRSLVFLKNFSSITMLRSAVVRDLVQGAAVLYRAPLTSLQTGLASIRNQLPAYSKLTALEKQDLRAIGGALNTVVNRLSYVTNADYTPQIGVWGKVTNFSEKVGNHARNNLLIDGSNVVRNWMESAGSSIATNRIIASLKKGGSSFTDDFGIDSDMGKRILEQFEKHGASSKFMGGNYYVSGVSRWDDAEAADAMSGSVWNFIRTITADATFQQNPFLKNTVAGNVLGTFTGFVNGMASRTLIPSLRRSVALPAFATMAGAGLWGAGRMMSDFMANGELPPEDAWMDRYIIAGAVNAAGFRYGDLSQRAYYGFGSPTAEELSEGDLIGKYGLQPQALLGAPAATGMNLLAGGAAAVEIGVQSAKEAITGEAPEISSSSVRAIRNITPYRNMMFMPMLLNEVEDEARAYYGLSPRMTLEERLRQ